MAPAAARGLLAAISGGQKVAHSVSAVERGASDIRERYTKMRLEAPALIDEMRAGADDA